MQILRESFSKVKREKRKERENNKMDDYRKGLRLVSACDNAIKTDVLNVWKDTVGGVPRIIFNGVMLGSTKERGIILDSPEATRMQDILNTEQTFNGEQFERALTVFDSMRCKQKTENLSTRVVDGVKYFVRYKSISGSYLSFSMVNEETSEYYILILNGPKRRGCVYTVRGKKSASQVLDILIHI